MLGKTKKKRTDTIDESEIAAALEARPDFFVRHPDCLSAMDLPVNVGPAISLHQYQVRVLREDQTQLKRKLGALIKNVKTNHKIHSDLLDLSGNMIQLAKDGASFDKYLHTISNYFALFSVKFVDKSGELDLFNIVKRTLGKHDNYCTHEADAKLLNALFSGDAPAVLSIAIVPVKRGKKYLGYLVLAADDAERFKAGMGGEFLKLLARLVSNIYDEPAKRR